MVRRGGSLASIPGIVALFLAGTQLVTSCDSDGSGSRSARAEPRGEPTSRGVDSGFDPFAKLRASASSTARAAMPAPSAPKPTPEDLAKGMKGSFLCEKNKKCQAGKEICIVAPNPDYATRCAPIHEWRAHRTPAPSDGLPGMAGVVACTSSDNCPERSFCCLHDINNASVQAIVCHASVDECRDKIELCDTEGSKTCRTPGTHCDGHHCVPGP